jgi:hypothetical protein
MTELAFAVLEYGFFLAIGVLMMVFVIIHWIREMYRGGREAFEYARATAPRPPGVDDLDEDDEPITARWPAAQRL